MDRRPGAERPAPHHRYYGRHINDHPAGGVGRCNQLWQMGKEVAASGPSGAWANPGTTIAVSGFNPATGAVPGPCGVNCTNNNEIYGFHPAGANVLFADGSVRLLKAGTDINIVIALMTRALGRSHLS